MISIKTLKGIKVNQRFKNLNLSFKSLILIKKRFFFKEVFNYKKLIYPIQETKQNPINYILALNILKTNSLINLSETNGNVLISLSGGNVNLKKKQKKLQPLALISLLKSLLLTINLRYNRSIAIHFTNVRPFHVTLITNLLKKLIFIGSIKIVSIQPHNGCRPQKFKKFKRRTRRKK